MNEALARENVDRESTQHYLRGQKDFLERHILPWLPALSAKIQGIEGLLFYPYLAHIALRITDSEYLMVRRLV